jgi:radical SAM protein with 4Fe4S-binding SPASM domain
MLWELRTREDLQTYKIGNQTVGCGNCEDKYICGGCRARSYGYFNGRLNEADIGCIRNEKIWKRMRTSVQ